MSEPDSDPPDPDPTEPAPPTRDEFLAWRSPRRGARNPERVDSPVWRWLIGARCNAFVANQRFDGPSPFDAGPGWCFDRMGMASVRLPDGRVVHIAGEHEDHYDPDFYIYNDVVVRHPDGRVEVLGYPVDVFPPTDFHSATLDERRGCVWIVGNLGYPDDRRVGATQVLRLDLATFAVTAVATAGDGPGWLHSHRAALDAAADALVVRGGIAQVDDDGAMVDRVDEWTLDLQGGRWRRVTRRPYEEWRFTRADGAPLLLFDIDRVLFARQHPEISDRLEEDERVLREAGGVADAALLGSLYRPPVPHTFVEVVDLDEPDEDEWGVAIYDDHRRFDQARVRVGDALVRYRVHFEELTLKVEGALEPAVAAAIRAHTADVLARLHGVVFDAVRGI